MFFIYRWLYRQVGFSRAQSNGFLLLLPLTIAFIFSAPLYKAYQSRRGPDFTAEDYQHLDSLAALFKPVSAGTAETLFYFDPNRISVADMRRLGIPATIAARIERFRASGGSFSAKHDLRKIYGLDSALYQRLYPYIQVPGYRTKTKAGPRGRLERTQDKIQRFDINLADTAKLKAIRGIGEKLSVRIVRYRDALGGFVSLKQIAEVYAMDSARVAELLRHCFIEANFQPKKININTAARQDIAGHPYISPRQAGSIVAYRFNHGNFGSIEDIARIENLDSVTFRKIRPYLTVD